MSGGDPSNASFEPADLFMCLLNSDVHKLPGTLASSPLLLN